MMDEEYLKEVEKDVFDKFIASYPNELKISGSTIGDPPVAVWRDQQHIVAKIYYRKGWPKRDWNHSNNSVYEDEQYLIQK